MSKLITREAFLSPLKRTIEEVPLPEFGEGVFVPVHSLTAKERTAFEASLRTKKGQPIESRIQKTRELLVVECCRDESGKKIFLPEDVSAISEQNAAVVERIVNVAMRLAGMTDTDVEALAKNSEGTPSSGSP